MTFVVVKVAHDVEAGVWYVESSDFPGLNVEAGTVELLREQAPLATADLVEASSEQGDFDIPIEIIAHSSERAFRRRVRAYGRMVREASLTVAVNIDSRHTANKVSEDAGPPKAF